MTWKSKKYNYTYKIINKINNMYYYGAHSTNTLLDGYLGGGVNLRKDIQKYGKENFNMEWIENYDTREEMHENEKLLITEKEVKDQMCYNIKLGGEGGSSKGRVLTDTQKENMSKIQKGLSKEETRHFLIISLKNSIGIYKTPFGDFYNRRDASHMLGIGQSTIERVCRFNNDKIPRKSVGCFSLIKDLKNKTWKEHGFYFIEFNEESKKKFIESKLRDSILKEIDNL